MGGSAKVPLGNGVPAMPGHLTCEERDLIVLKLSEGADQREIAQALGRSEATISRELRRNQTDGEYQAAQAQRRAETRRRERPISRKMDDPEINAFVRQGLAKDWSPEQIAGRRKLECADEPRKCVSPQTIYSWIETDSRSKEWRQHLRRRGKRPYRRKKAEMQGSPIANRPAEIESRSRIGDLEGDTVVGPAGTGGIVTLVCRRTRYTHITKVNSKESNTVQRKIRDRLKKLPPAQRRSITFDNGTEFARSHRLEKHLGVAIYFAEPGRPYQRGTNENTNGLIRQYFPKRTDFRSLSHQRLRKVENLLNNRPRKCLGFRTSAEASLEESQRDNCD